MISAVTAIPKVIQVSSLVSKVIESLEAAPIRVLAGSNDLHESVIEIKCNAEGIHIIEVTGAIEYCGNDEIKRSAWVKVIDDTGYEVGFTKAIHAQFDQVAEDNLELEV